MYMPNIYDLNVECDMLDYQNHRYTCKIGEGGFEIVSSNDGEGGAEHDGTKVR